MSLLLGSELVRHASDRHAEDGSTYEAPTSGKPSTPGNQLPAANTRTPGRRWQVVQAVGQALGGDTGDPEPQNRDRERQRDAAGHLYREGVISRSR